MKKKICILTCIAVVLIIILGLQVLNDSNSYDSFIKKNFSEEFLQETSETQRLIRSNVLERVFAIVNLEDQNIESLQISDEIEEDILKRINDLENYFECIPVEELKKKEEIEGFNKFREDSLTNLRELYSLIDNYNETIVQEESITSNYYFDLQQKLTEPIETINPYIMLIDSEEK